MSGAHSEVEQRLRMFSWIAAIAGALILAFVFVVMLAVVIVSLRVGESAQAVKDTVDNNRLVLCAVKANADKQVIATEKFIEENPNGIPGITLGDLQASLQRQRDFAAALRGLEC